MMNKKAKWTTGAIAALALATTVVGCGQSQSQGQSTTPSTGGSTSGGAVTINETGSSLLYPLFNGQWIGAYKSVDSNVSITAASTGSGAGISQAIAGTVQIGASDAFMSDQQMQQNPSMVNIPLSISAQQIMYNVPGVSADQHLNLSGDVLANIFTGKIKYWDDPAIASANTGVKLPHDLIVPVHRSDGSGDTFLFTQYLSDQSAAWKGSVAYGTTVSWPSVQGGIGAQGNDGVVQSLSSTKDSIGYVGISWLDKATQKGLGYAALKNKDGKYVLPTTANIQTAANAMVSNVPDDERISLIDAPGATSYPIINFEYAIVNTKQSADMATSLKKFLNWAISTDGGNKDTYLSPVHFLPLPSSIAPKSQAQINKIGS